MATMASWRTTCDMCKYHHDLNFELRKLCGAWQVHRTSLSIFWYLLPVLRACRDSHMQRMSNHNGLRIKHLSPIYYLKAPRCFVYSTLNLAENMCESAPPPKNTILCAIPPSTQVSHGFPVTTTASWWLLPPGLLDPLKPGKKQKR